MEFFFTFLIFSFLASIFSFSVSFIDSLFLTSIKPSLFVIDIFFWASNIVCLINSQYKFIARLASSLPGIGKFIPVGSELVSIIAIIDTNSDPTGINFPIPGNDDARRAINLYCELIKQTILDAQKNISITNKEGLIDVKNNESIKETEKEKIEAKKEKIKKVKKNSKSVLSKAKSSITKKIK